MAKKLVQIVEVRAVAYADEVEAEEFLSLTDEGREIVRQMVIDSAKKDYEGFDKVEVSASFIEMEDE